MVLFHLIALARSFTSCQEDEEVLNAGNDLPLVGTDLELMDALEYAGGVNGVNHFLLPESHDLDNIPQDPNNPLSNVKIELGRKLFYETGLAIHPNNPASTGTYSCASCHVPKAGFKPNNFQGIADGGIGFGIDGDGRAVEWRFATAMLKGRHRSGNQKEGEGILMAKKKHLPIILPALRGIMGDWAFYSCLMSMKELASRVSYADEIHKNKNLSDMIQRKLQGGRSKQIASYIEEQSERFFNSLVVATYGGEPNWLPIGSVKTSGEIDGLEELPDDTISSVGFLTFTGGENLFAIDGQHRLSGIKQAVKSKFKEAIGFSIGESFFNLDAEIHVCATCFII